MNILDIVNLKKDLKDYYSGLEKQMQTMWDTYNGNLSWILPDGIPKHIPPTASAVVDTAVDHIMSLAFDFKAMPHKETQGAQEKAIARSKMLKRIWGENNRSAEVSIWRDVVKHLFLYGVGIFKGALFLPEYWEDEPKRAKGELKEAFDDRVDAWETRRKNSCPVGIIAVDPSTVYLDPSRKPKFCVESYTRKVISLKSAFPTWLPPAGLKPFEDVEWTEYWDEDKRLCFISYGQSHDIIPITSEMTSDFIPNVYGFIPYTRIYSGLGTATPQGLPEHRAIGLLHRAHDSILAEARLSTAIDSQVESSAWRGFTLKLPEGMSEENAKIKWGPAQVTYLPPEAEFEPTAALQMTPDTFRHLQDIKNEIEQGTLSRALQGERTAGVYAGYYQAILVAQGRIRLEAVINSFMNGLAQVSSRILQVVESVVREPVFGCKPSDINGFYDVNVEVDTKTPEERDRRIQLGLSLIGELSWETRAKEYYGVEDPYTEQKRILVEGVMQDPMFRQVITEAAMETLGMQEILQRVKEKLAQTGAQAGTQGGAQPEMPLLKRGGMMPSAGLGSKAETEITPSVRGR